MLTKILGNKWKNLNIFPGGSMVSTGKVFATAPCLHPSSRKSRAPSTRPTSTPTHQTRTTAHQTTCPAGISTFKQNLEENFTQLQSPTSSATIIFKQRRINYNYYFKKKLQQIGRISAIRPTLKKIIFQKKWFLKN